MHHPKTLFRSCRILFKVQVATVSRTEIRLFKYIVIGNPRAAPRPNRTKLEHNTLVGSLKPSNLREADIEQGLYMWLGSLFGNKPSSLQAVRTRIKSETHPCKTQKSSNSPIAKRSDGAQAPRIHPLYQLTTA